MKRALAAGMLLLGAQPPTVERFAVSDGDADATCVATTRTLPRLPLRVAITLPATGEVRAGTVTSISATTWIRTAAWVKWRTRRHAEPRGAAA